jgi:uncharacterized protein with gpF-like domain
MTLMNETRAVRELARNYSNAIDEIRNELAKLYERYAENGVLTHSEMSKYNRLRNLERHITEELQPSILKNNALIEKISEVQYEEAFYRHAWSIDQTVGVGLRWGGLSADQIRAAVENDLRHLAARDLANSTLTRVRRSIAQGLTRGVSLNRMMREIRSAMETTVGQAMRIVRTEAHRARELGGMRATDIARERGVNIVRIWDATLDDRTRPRHASLDGQQEQNGGWMLSGVKAEYPGDPALPASQSIHCRCSAVDEVEGYSPRLRRIRGEGLQPYQTFGEWARGRGIKANRYGEQYNFLEAN